MSEDPPAPASYKVLKNGQQPIILQVWEYPPRSKSTGNEKGHPCEPQHAHKTSSLRSTSTQTSADDQMDDSARENVNITQWSDVPCRCVTDTGKEPRPALFYNTNYESFGISLKTPSSAEDPTTDAPATSVSVAPSGAQASLPPSRAPASMDPSGSPASLVSPTSGSPIRSGRSTKSGSSFTGPAVPQGSRRAISQFTSQPSRKQAYSQNFEYDPADGTGCRLDKKDTLWDCACLSLPGDETERSAGRSYSVKYRKSADQTPLITWKKKNSDKYGVLLVQRGKSHMVVKIPIDEVHTSEVMDASSFYNFCMLILILISTVWAYMY